LFTGLPFLAGFVACSRWPATGATQEPVVHSLEEGRFRRERSEYVPGMDGLLADELRTDRTDSDRERCAALLDAAQDHLQNKRPEQAMAIWRQLIERGGQGGEDASAEYADYLFRCMWDDDEESRLQAEMADGRLSWLNWLRAAVLLERRGQLVDALILYAQATVDIPPEQVSRSRWAKLIVTGRRRVKWALGMELDSLDLLGDAGYVEAMDNYFDLLDLLREPTVVRGRVQVWSRAELTVAQEHWPGRITAESIDAYYREVESVLRRYDERVIVMHQSFAFTPDSVDALDQRVADACPTELPDDETAGVPWPPDRNQPCWCGSDTKYKKCCGAGGLPSGPRQAWGPAGLRSGAQLAIGRV